MKRFIALLLGIGMACGVSGCRDEGPMEKAGRTIDETVEKLQHGDEGALEKAGRKTDEALEKAEKKLEEAS